MPSYRLSKRVSLVELNRQWHKTRGGQYRSWKPEEKNSHGHKLQLALLNYSIEFHGKNSTRPDAKGYGTQMFFTISRAGIF